MVRTRFGGWLRWAPAIVAGAALLVSVDASADSWGVPLGRKTVRGTVDVPGDSDAFLVEAPPGGRLSVRVKVPRGSDLDPGLGLRGPDGADLAPPVVKGRKISGFDLTEAGRYEIRVFGVAGSTGAYAVSARVRGGLGAKQTGLVVPARDEHTVPFTAGGGGRVSFSVKGRGVLPGFARIESPLGMLVPVGEGVVRVKGRRLFGKDIALPEGQPFGAWSLVLVGAGDDSAKLKVRVKVRGGRLTPFKGSLPDEEPLLLTAAPFEVGVGSLVDVLGRGLSTSETRPLRLFFGGVEATDVRLTGTTSVTATFPEGPSGLTDVSILNGDGHAASLTDELLVIPPPQPTALDPVRGPGQGGTVVEVRGTGFRPGAAVTLDGVAYAERTEFENAGLLWFTTPPQAGGSRTVGVRDPTGQLGLAPANYEFVPGPAVASARPDLVPRISGADLRVDGDGLDAETILVGGAPPMSSTLTGTTRLDLTLPALALGNHDVLVREEEFGQEARLDDAITVFDFADGVRAATTGGPPPSDMAVADYDDDGDLDVFLVSPGGGSLSATSLLRVLRNDRAAGFTDVTTTVIPTPTVDDWRADVIVFADVAADVGETPPDGPLDIVLGSTDEGVLPGTRSRIRILANRRAPGGGREFVDRTAILMPENDAFDDWKAADLWIGDLDGDAGVDIVATQNATPSGESPVPGVDRVYYLSGTRVFPFSENSGGGYGRFTADLSRFPRIIGARGVEPGVPQCQNGDCADDYTPFRGTSLMVLDFDDDGFLDVAVTAPDTVKVDGNTISSTQIARNVPGSQQGERLMQDFTHLLNVAGDDLSGVVGLAGHVVGDPKPDLVIVRESAASGERAVSVVENFGFETTWGLRSSTVLPEPVGDERLQADAAALVDVDGDGDLDVVLVTPTAPAGGRGLRILRNHEAFGFDFALDVLLPAPGAGDDGTGSALAVSEPAGPAGALIFFARPDAAGTGAEVRSIDRITDE